MEIGEEGLGEVPRAEEGLDWVGEEKELVDAGLAAVREVHLVIVRTEVVVFVLEQHPFLVLYEVVGLPQDEVHSRMGRGPTPQLVRDVHEEHQKGNHVEPTAEDRETMDGSRGEVSVEPNTEYPQHEDRQEKEVHHPVQMLLPESLSEEGLRPFLDPFGWGFLGEDASYEEHHPD